MKIDILWLAVGQYEAITFAFCPYVNNAIVEQLDAVRVLDAVAWVAAAATGLAMVVVITLDTSGAARDAVLAMGSADSTGVGAVDAAALVTTTAFATM